MIQKKSFKDALKERGLDTRTLSEEEIKQFPIQEQIPQTPEVPQVSNIENEITYMDFAVRVRQKIALQNIWEVLKRKYYKNMRRRYPDKMINLHMLFRAWLDIIIEILPKVNLEGAVTEEEVKKRILKVIKEDLQKGGISNE